MICQGRSASSNTEMDLSTAISQVRRLLLGHAVPVHGIPPRVRVHVVLRPTGIARPSDAVAQAGAWAGLNANDTIAAWAQWVNDPDRSGAVLAVAIVLVTISLVAVTAHANVRTPPLRWRGSSTFFVGLAPYLQATSRGTSDRSALGSPPTWRFTRLPREAALCLRSAGTRVGTARRSTGT
jgi:hypothetical protein